MAQGQEAKGDKLEILFSISALCLSFFKCALRRGIFYYIFLVTVKLQ